MKWDLIVKAVDDKLKNKGMIAVICAILVLGIMTTAVTCHIIGWQTENDIVGLADTEDLAAGSDKIQEDKQILQEQVSNGSTQEEGTLKEELLSPLGSENGISPEEYKASDNDLGYTAKYFKERLDDIDDIIKRMEDSASVNTTEGLLEAASYEYRLWDAELNQIYQSIMEVISDKESDGLRVRERRWIRKRDEAAKNASKKYKGGAMENVEYTSSLAESTRERAYELLELYGSYLPDH